MFDDMGTIVLVLTVLAIIGGVVLAFWGTFRLVDELHKEKPFGIDFRKMNLKLQNVPKTTTAGDIGAWETAKPKPALGESTEKKPRRPVPPKGSVLKKGIPPGKRKLDI